MNEKSASCKVSGVPGAGRSSTPRVLPHWNCRGLRVLGTYALSVLLASGLSCTSGGGSIAEASQLDVGTTTQANEAVYAAILESSAQQSLAAGENEGSIVLCERVGDLSGRGTTSVVKSRCPPQLTENASAVDRHLLCTWWAQQNMQGAISLAAFPSDCQRSLALLTAVDEARFVGNDNGAHYWSQFHDMYGQQA